MTSSRAVCCVVLPRRDADCGDQKVEPGTTYGTGQVGGESLCWTCRRLCKLYRKISVKMNSKTVFSLQRWIWRERTLSDTFTFYISVSTV